MTNSLTPHSSKCEVTLLHRGAFIGPYSLIIIGNVDVAWVCHARLLGITADNVNVAEVCHARLLGITVDWKLTYTKHLTELRTLSLNWIYLKIALSQRGNLCLTYILRWFSLLWQTTSRWTTLQELHCRWKDKFQFATGYTFRSSYGSHSMVLDLWSV